MTEVKTFLPPQIRMDEILRYSLSDKENPPTQLISECLLELSDKLTFKVASCRFPVKIQGDFVDFGFAKVRSASLAKNLSGCNEAILFCATIGMEIDRLIAKYGRISPSKAVLFQAIGAERIEALCGAFNDEITETYQKDGLYTKPRFSPGYGDYPLEAQKDIFRVLDCYRKIGVSLNESMLMSPSKSVTAIIGISKEKTECKNSCSLCGKTDCAFRSR